MTSNILLIVVEELLKIFKKYKIDLVLMGGIATSILAKPRATFDIDGLISITENEIKKLLPELRKKGFRFDQKKPLKRIQGLPFLTLYFSLHKTYVDLFIALSEFQKRAIKRARQIRYNKINIKIISPEDLILIKLQSGREKDIEDVREIMMENKDKIDHKYLKRWAKKLGVQMFLEDEMRSLGIRARS